MINENEKLKAIRTKIYDYIEHIAFAVVNRRLSRSSALEMINNYINDNILFADEAETQKFYKYFKDELSQYQFEKTSAPIANLNEDEFDNFEDDEDDFRNPNVDRESDVVKTKKKEGGNDETIVDESPDGGNAAAGSGDAAEGGTDEVEGAGDDDDEGDNTSKSDDTEIIRDLIYKKAYSLAKGMEYVFNMIFSENHPPIIMTNWNEEDAKAAAEKSKAAEEKRPDESEKKEPEQPKQSEQQKQPEQKTEEPKPENGEKKEGDK